MVNVLYAVTALVCSLVLILLPLRMRRNLSRENPVDRAFLKLINWTAAFCMIDCIWGVLASELINNAVLLFIFSSVFHFCAAFTPLLWLNYVLVYLGGTRYEKLYRIFFNLMFLAQCVLLVINFFNHMMFSVDAAGIYTSTPVRRLLFYMQYLTYVLIAVYSTVRYLTGEGRRAAEEQRRAISRNSYLYAILFVAAPILTGIFQMIYPDAPAYSIGYMLGCCIIYSFVVTDMLNSRMIEKAVAQASSQAKTEFLFNMSHDIRTPMNAILGYTEIAIRHRDEPDKVDEGLKKSRTAGGHLLNLINDILEMSRIEAGMLEISPVPLDIREAISGVDQMSRALAVAKSIDFRTVVGNIADPYVYADELHVNQVLINLISNAVKYTDNGGRVEYRAEQLGEPADGTARYRFAVSDTGIGMSEEFQKHLFENFVRENDAAVAKQEGAGLGLAIVKRITDLSGGTVTVRSIKGEGSTFIVELPFRVMNEAEIERFGRENHPEEVCRDADLQGRRVLLVEDNEMNREIGTELLKEAGLAVDTAEDGEIALRAVAEKGTEYYDFILMDIQMPVMDGYEATKAIRALPGGGSIPIIALSANAFEEDRRKSLEAGMNDHIAKPVEAGTLFACMKKYM